MRENAPFPVCPMCGGEWKYYDGALGYESLICDGGGKHAEVDINDLNVSAFELLELVKDAGMKAVLQGLALNIWTGKEIKRIEERMKKEGITR
jgi:hypothetical protein